MALNDNQKALAKSIGVAAGKTMHVLPDQADILEYAQIVKDTVDEVVNTAQAPSDNPAKDITDAWVEVAVQVDNNLPDSKGKTKFGHLLAILKGFIHLFGF